MSRKIQIAAKHTSAKKDPSLLLSNRYNPPISMSKRTAKRWAKVAPPMKPVKDPYGKDVKETPIDLAGRIQNPLVSKFSFKKKIATVEDKDHGEKLVDLVAKYFRIQASLARLMILRGEIFVTGTRHADFVDRRPNSLLNAGDVIVHTARFSNNESNQKNVFPEASILYKDQDVLIINKPGGISAHSGSKHASFNLETILSQISKDEQELRLVHRLDKDTTGCLIVARTKESANRMTRLFQTRGMIHKQYIALVTPGLDKKVYPVGYTDKIETGITTFGQEPKQRQKIVNWHDDFLKQKETDIKKAITNVTVVSNSKKMSVLCLEPLTGRKHQLRLHCIHKFNSHIIGDSKYGRVDPKAISSKTKMYLHLMSIRVQDYFGPGNDLNCTAPVSKDFKKMLEANGIDPSVLTDRVLGNSHQDSMAI